MKISGSLVLFHDTQLKLAPGIVFEMHTLKVLYIPIYKFYMKYQRGMVKPPEMRPCCDRIWRWETKGQ